MKRILALLLIIIAINSAHAQWTVVKDYDSLALDFASDINSVAVDTSGNVYVATAGTACKWNGQRWYYLPALNGGVWSIATDAAGNFYIGATLNTSEQNITKTYVAKWNGTAWAELGAGSLPLSVNGGITQITTDRSGNIYAAGTFLDTFNFTSYRNFVAKWNGSVWSILDTTSSLFDGAVNSIVTDTSGNLYAAGLFYDSIDSIYVLKWDGNAWSIVGTGSNGLHANWGINSLAFDPAGNFYAAGNFTDAANNQYVAKWNGSNWTELGTGSNALNVPANINAVIADNAGNIYASVGLKLYEWNGTNWSIPDSGILGLNNHAPVTCMTRDVSGKVYLGGQFTNIFGHNYVATWDGVQWGDVSPGSDDMDYLASQSSSNSRNGYINALTTDLSGNIYVSWDDTWGESYLAKWNGHKWDQLDKRNSWIGNTTDYGLLVTDSSGNLYSVKDSSLGNRYVVKWNGSNWAEVGNNLPFYHIDYMAIVGPSGDLLVSGNTVNWTQENVAKWNGNSWVQLGTGSAALNANGGIGAMTEDATGNIYTGGTFTDSNGYLFVAKWDGSAWSHLGHLDSLVNSLGINSIVVGAAGAVYSSGANISTILYTPGFVPYDYSWISKWDGSSWSNFGPGFYANNVFLNGDVFVSKDLQGNIYGTGFFLDSLSYAVNGIDLTYVDLWNGSEWTEMLHSAWSFDDGNSAGRPIYSNGNFYAASGIHNGIYEYMPSLSGCIAPMDQEICLVTIDTTTDKPVVVWDKANKYATDSFYIYRAATPGTGYAQIAILNPDSLSEWSDTSAYPDLMSYRYKISVRDTCGRLEALSPYHQTIYLTYLGLGQFSWTPYVIEDTASPVTSYGFYRDAPGNGNWQLLTTVGAAQTTASDPNYASYPNARYMVIVTLANPCTPSRGLASICSNIISTGSTGLAGLTSENIKVVPNPSHDNFTIQTNMAGEEMITISDMLGRIVYQGASDSGPQTIDATGWAKGIYSCRIQIGGQSYQARLVRD